MTEKRFTINGKEIIQDKQVWCMANSEHCADVISTAMNELHEENLRLQGRIQEYEEIIGGYIDENKEIRKKVNALHEENQALKRENNNRRALLVDELRGLFQMYLTQCRSISEEAIITMIKRDVKKRVFEVFDE